MKEITYTLVQKSKEYNDYFSKCLSKATPLKVKIFSILNGYWSLYQNFESINSHDFNYFKFRTDSQFYPFFNGKFYTNFIHIAYKIFFKMKVKS